MPWKPRGEWETFPSLGSHVAEQMIEYLDFYPSREQFEFLVRFYELDPLTCKRVKRRGIIQRPRGWGKSPLLGAEGISEALFEVVPDGWDANGQPVAIPWAHVKNSVNVVVTATSEEQVANTWAPMLELARSDALVNEFDIEPMESFIALPKGRIEPRTSAGRSIKGLPDQVCALMDQTEEWLKGNGGIRLAQNLRNNATKASGVTLESPNAFTPGEGSVAEASARDWDLIKSGKYPKLSEARQILYDHREAPAATDPADRESLIAGLRYAFGCSSDHPDGCVLHGAECNDHGRAGWAPIDSYALAFLDTSNDPQVLRADFLNQITHATDSFVSQPDLRAIIEDKTITKSEPVTLGFDGSSGRARHRAVADCTVLVGYSVTQKHLFKIGLWAQPEGPSGEGWQPPKLEVEQAVAQAFKDYNVVGFYADPSEGWAGEVKQWEATHNRRLKAKVTVAEPIRWKQKDVSRTCETFDQLHTAIVNREITFDGHPDMVAHFLHARRDKRRAGYVLKKPDDDQDFAKIDLTWGSMFAFAAGLDALGKGALTARKGRPRRIY